MARAIAITLVVEAATPISATFGPADVMAAAKAALIVGGFTVYTDGAESQLVAIPSNEADPHEAGL